MVMRCMSKPERRSLTAAPAASGRVPQTATTGLPVLKLIMAATIPWLKPASDGRIVEMLDRFCDGPPRHGPVSILSRVLNRIKNGGVIY